MGYPSTQLSISVADLEVTEPYRAQVFKLGKVQSHDFPFFLWVKHKHRTGQVSRLGMDMKPVNHGGPWWTMVNWGAERQVIIAPELKQFRAFKRPSVNWRRCSRSAWAWHAAEHGWGHLGPDFLKAYTTTRDSEMASICRSFYVGFYNTCFYQIRLLGVARIHTVHSDRMWWKDVKRHLGKFLSLNHW